MSNIMNPIDDPSYNVDATEQAFGTNRMYPNHGASAYNNAPVGSNSHGNLSQSIASAKPQSGSFGNAPRGATNSYNTFGTSTTHPLRQETSSISNIASPTTTLGTSTGHGFQEDLSDQSARHNTIGSSTKLNDGSRGELMDHLPSADSRLGHMKENIDTPRGETNRDSARLAQYSTPSTQLSRGSHPSDQLSSSREPHLGHMTASTGTPCAETNRDSAQAARYSTGASKELDSGSHPSDQVSHSREPHLAHATQSIDTPRAGTDRNSTQDEQHNIIPSDDTADLRSASRGTGARTANGAASSRSHGEVKDEASSSAERTKDRMEGNLDSDLNGEKVNGIAGVIPISGSAGPTTTKTFNPHATVDGSNHHNTATQPSNPAETRNGDMEHSPRDVRTQSSNIGSSSYNTPGSGHAQSTAEPLESHNPRKGSVGMTSDVKSSEAFGSQRAA
ncbi:uncharacterized protein BO97DRAFT_403656 [Aspergillus homomorphus CBS 101889]|uniref:Uncharacterized protein n=1 Tax=Aspergillus homomorphus (strain CBS 101889) TaxID=1450537 RepID=A0A395I491_ASPHC|nr:hypothetical protein BO97DRAFT_403656 [Aspergillus homomorphus CBS 101889]RAL15021.1 hypothetical protein BO97DRAFT_403656 [Aspergillus homomorphus CBS 101889]